MMKTKSATIRINENLKDFSNDPYFVSKHAKAKAFLEQHPFPEHLIKEQLEKRKKK